MRPVSIRYIENLSLSNESLALAHETNIEKTKELREQYPGLEKLLDLLTKINLEREKFDAKEQAKQNKGESKTSREPDLFKGQARKNKSNRSGPARRRSKRPPKTK